MNVRHNCRKTLLASAALIPLLWGWLMQTHPFTLTLFAHDGIAPEDGEFVKIGIKQVQMEQDTAKSISHPEYGTMLDFNRVSHPLVEIITLPQIHHPATAAA